MKEIQTCTEVPPIKTIVAFTGIEFFCIFIPLAIIAACLGKIAGSK